MEEGGQWSSRPRGEGATVGKHAHLRRQSVDQNGSECPQSAVVLFTVVIVDECVSLKASCGIHETQRGARHRHRKVGLPLPFLKTHSSKVGLSPSDIKADGLFL